VSADGRFASDVYTVVQLYRPMVNLYRVTADDRLVAFVRQKRMALKEDLRFFADEDEREELFRIKARSVFDLGTRYDIIGADGVPIGAVQKRFGRSLLRSTWDIIGADDAPVAWAHERSMGVSVLRRVIEMVPYADMVPIPYHFTIHVGDATVGEVNRRWGVRDHYTLDLTSDAERRIDRRIGVALAVGLDALQSR
jgi:uncharacterized protein YxjI